MKKSFFITTLVISMTLIFNACNNPTSKDSAVESKTVVKATYTCTMHPEVRKDKPGDCPICGMPLVRKEPPDSTQAQHLHDTVPAH
jgi:Cu(I)/Ag(I) efflux system membrane fusion protein